MAYLFRMKPGTIVLCCFLFPLVFFLLSCGDCSKKIDCPGYKDDTLDAWFPYGSMPQLIFESNTAQKDTFTLRNTETTAPYQANGGLFSPVRCEAHKTFQSLELDTFKRNKMTVELNSVDKNRMAYFTVGSYSLGIYGMQANGLGQVSAGSRYLLPKILPAVTLGNRTYTNVIEATGDTVTTKVSGIYKVYYAQGEGLVSYSEYPSLTTWTKQ
jgi:hypothetical protein